MANEVTITVKETTEPEQTSETTASDADLNAEFGRLMANYAKADTELHTFLRKTSGYEPVLRRANS